MKKIKEIMENLDLVTQVKIQREEIAILRLELLLLSKRLRKLEKNNDA